MSCCTSAPIVTQTCETLLSKCEVPIIDLAHMGTERCPQKGVVKQVASKLLRALSEKGLALLVNHGIPECKMKAAYRAFDAFCELPDEVRVKYERATPNNYGYVKPGPSKYTDEKEARHVFNVTGCEGILPDEEVPGFRSAVDELTRDFKQLSAMLLTALAVGLEQSPDFLLSKHSHMLGPGNESTLRLLYYPPLGAPAPGLARCGAHCDYGTFTLLAQDCEGGLEIQTPYGERWGRVGHLPGAILVNTGDILANWTNNQLPALRHRVVVPELYGRGRHSIAFFVHPDNNIPIEPLDTKIIKANQEPAPCRLQKKKRGVLTAYQHLQRRLRETYAS
ncbi:Proline hydroxylase buaE [Anthophora plagiata]